MNNEELEFARKHNLQLDWFFDAKGSPMTTFVKDKMRQNEKLFAYNCAPCNQGHSLKSRKGHCIVCDTSDIAFYLRHYQSGYVYIAASLKAMRIKIGSTSNIKNREKDLNFEKGYGNFSDWTILCFIHTLEVGKHETALHNILSPYREPPIEYKKSKEYQKAQEIFRCSYQKAYEAFQTYFSLQAIHIHAVTLDFTKYKFPNLARP